ncbi:MAG: hypothetical protein M9931_09445 [Chitinophagales bacterium]|nr:hypothetical protein [Chitinophagales bacterium]OJV24107.1 MAG: hypothetical protein BGO32_03630 [Bacteroidetes bacterium 37-13]HRN93585.1 hypothetical protein [Chitinophagales bacterium]HRP39914.1 hypothetical protein [Chitinophagales bacterium]
MKVTLIGASGLAKDLVGAFGYENYIRGVTLFDNVTEANEEILSNHYPIIRTKEALKKHFETVSPFFIVAIASPAKRRKMAAEIKALGGINISYFCSQALISQFTEMSEQGVIIQLGCNVSSECVLEEGVFLNVRCMLGHGVKIGKYTTLSPDVKVLGNVSIGENCVIATGVTIMPNVKVGNNVKIGMNKLITSDIPDNTELF